MKKLFLNLITLSLLSNISLAESYNVVITQEHTKYKDSEIAMPEPNIASSCKEILDNGNSIGDGLYEIEVNSKVFNIRCDMTTNGGGWSLIVLQYESNPISNWNEGIQSSYLEPNKSFVLNLKEIPVHTQMAVGQTEFTGWRPTVEYFNYIYKTGNISLTNLVGLDSGATFQIHRNKDNYYNNHDPEFNVLYSLPEWNNTLTIDWLSSGDPEYTYAFSPNHYNKDYTGYSYLGLKLESNNGGWTVWVR